MREPMPIMDVNICRLAKAVSELDKSRAALTLLIESFTDEAGPKRVVLTENMLYLVEDGLNRVNDLLSQEYQNREAEQ